MLASSNIQNTHSIIQKLVQEYKITQDYTTLLSFIDSIRYRNIRKVFLSDFISALCFLDAEINIEYETTTEEEWEQVQSECGTPLENDEHVRLKNEIKCFTTAYLEIRKFLKNIKLEIILKCFDESVFLSSTRNTQFLLFDLCDMDYDSVFKHLISKIQTSSFSSFYIPIFSTLLVRYKNIMPSDQEILVKWFYKYLKKHKTLINIQFFLYIIIFFHKKDFIKKYLFFTDNLYCQFGGQIINIVGSMYAKIYNKKFCSEIERSNDVKLKTFTFDSPIINKVSELYIDRYVDFEP
ncbi:hypothetical protein CDIK_1946 [Cucumispora dikerogammari]|nr:hypothetical protein CDIK_1946 [Cucumispora dikerogammari]